LLGDSSVTVHDVRQDSRRIEPGDLFVARAGSRANGLDYVADAVRRGASAVLAESGAKLEGVPVPVVEVKNLRLAVALASEAVHGHPTRSLRVVAVTGTNGKTTTVSLVQQAIDMAGGRAARIGTLGFAFGSDSWEGTLTTPEADDISRFAAQVRAAGATHLVLEASSHALDQQRVDGLSHEVAAFTNLTQDHLDYHPSMELYAQAKERLFLELAPTSAVLNLDDPRGRLIAQRTRARAISYGSAPEADFWPRDVRVDAQGIQGRIVSPAGEVTLESRLVGWHNLQNLLCALGILYALGLELEPAARALGAMAGVPGRLERCDQPGDDILVLVDYAHTPDALERALAAVRGLTSGQLICVFGCGGDRDPGKRPQMGHAVGRAADLAIISNDNPRTEDPTAIARAIEPGVAAHGIPYQVILDRCQAIQRAVSVARPGDVVLIAGKGHEPYQIFGTSKRPFDDRLQARHALALRRSQGAA
jgi:UDP-N-acetylmuramoyl-L-alanyl-D-glutamate--2,6-diaminopimelate ligase